MLETAHGLVETPVFMPVATQASVKALSQEDLASLGIRAILANSYHLALRPGSRTIQAAGGLHRFMGYEGMILTDSGGFQVMSLAGLRSVEDSGVAFKSHLDGSLLRLTPGRVIELQAELGSDCWTSLDVCPPYPCSEREAAEALRRTMKWAEDSLPALELSLAQGRTPLFFPILQGSFYPDLRRQAAEHLASLPAQGAALGGFSVGEAKELTWETLERTLSWLPQALPRYLMGVGTPADLWEAAALGVDMMDCVFPTRVARNGQAMTRRGRLNIGNSPFRQDFGPLDPECSCFVCARYSRSYLNHLFRCRELSSYRLLTIHNLHLMAQVTAEIRSAIREGRFQESRRAFLNAQGGP